MPIDVHKTTLALLPADLAALLRQPLPESLLSVLGTSHREMMDLAWPGFAGLCYAAGEVALILRAKGRCAVSLERPPVVLAMCDAHFSGCPSVRRHIAREDAQRLVVVLMDFDGDSIAAVDLLPFDGGVADLSPMEQVPAQGAGSVS